MNHCYIAKFIALLLITLCGSSYHKVYAQHTYKGVYLVNKESKVPLPEAVVQGAGFTAIADENGFVNLDKLPDTVSEIVISRIGYQTQLINLSLLDKTINIPLIFLDEKVTSLKEVAVVASARSGIFKTISDLDIHLRPINNSQEVLRMVPGLFIGQHAGGGKSEQIFLRGFDIDHGTDISLSVDGMPVNMVSHAHGQGYADLHFLIPELIDKVNFNKGPYYADKGNFTTAGYVDFKTKNYLDNNFVKVEGGQFNTFRGIAGVNLLKNDTTRRNQSLYFAGEGSFTKGYFISPQNFKRFNGMLKYHGNINKSNTLTASVTGFTSNWKASGQIPQRAVDDGTIDFYGAIDDTEGGKTSRYNANVELTSYFANGGKIRNRVFYTHYEFKLFSNFTFFKNDSVNGDQIRQGEDRNLAGYSGSYEKEFFIGNIKTETSVGIQVRYDKIKDLELTRTKDRDITTLPIQFGDVNELNTGAYWSQKFFLTNKLDVTGGVRADNFSNNYNDKISGVELSSQASIISPKLNFNYRLNNRVQLYWYNGRGFHTNDTRVAVKQNGKKVVPPGWGTDLGGVFKLGDKIVLQTALWYLWLDQEFIYVGDEGVVEPGGKSQRTGIDASIRYEMISNLFMDVDLSVANPRALESSKEESYLPLAPRFTSTGGLTYRKQSGWNGSLRYRYMADRPANEDYSVVAQGYFIIDAAINYSKKKYEVGLSIQNVLNTQWKETQFDTESKLKDESKPVSEIHFTPGTPFFARLSYTLYF